MEVGAGVRRGEGSSGCVSVGGGGGWKSGWVSVEWMEGGWVEVAMGVGWRRGVGDGDGGEGGGVGTGGWVGVEVRV